VQKKFRLYRQRLFAEGRIEPPQKRNVGPFQELLRHAPGRAKGFFLHELGITQSIVEIALRTAAGQNAKIIHSVTLEVGSLAGVVPAALQFCYEACSKETLLEGSRLIIDEVPAQARCRNCATDYPLPDLLTCCPGCGSVASDLLCGEELRIKEMEVD
jgi:hydrogenase nickel incorporation protein HypA/HybF